MSSTKRNSPRWRPKSFGILLVAYCLSLAAIIALVLEVRHTTLREMSTPEARAQWDAWREAEPNQSDHGPVRRRPPSTSEPPALLLMRDHFPVVMAAAVIFGSLLFAAIALAIRGVMPTSPPDPDRMRLRSR